MPEYLSPGVYVEEVASGPRPIEGVSTSTAGFAGRTERGTLIPQLVTSWAEYVRWYGGFTGVAASTLPYAVKGFFDNGGQRVFIARITGPNPGTAAANLPTAAGTMAITALGPGAWGNNLLVSVRQATQARVNPALFRIMVAYYSDGVPAPFIDPTDRSRMSDPARVEPDVFEDYDNVSASPADLNYFVTTINSRSRLIHIPGTPDRPNALAFPVTAGADLLTGDANTRLHVASRLGGASVATVEVTAGGASDVNVLVRENFDNLTPASVLRAVNGASAAVSASWVQLNPPAPAPPARPDNGGPTAFAAGRVDVTTANPNTALRLQARAGRTPVSVTIADGANPGTFQVSIEVEAFNNVTAQSIVNTINSGSNYIQVEWQRVNPPTPFTPSLPTVAAAAPLAGGSGIVFAGALVPEPAPTEASYSGDDSLPVDQRTGLAALALIDEISLLCIPDEYRFSSGAVTDAMLDQCEQLRDRFAVLSTGINANGTGEPNVTRVIKPRDSSYGAAYYPRIRIFDDYTQQDALIPPSGHVTGIYARTDTERGVHKAPANEVIRGIVTRDLSADRKPLEFTLSKGQHDLLNPRGIDVIRDFRPQRRDIRVWGARTMSSDSQWKYINVRRLFIFIEESIDEGTQWVVFEPNDAGTWSSVVRSVTGFLTSVWRSGALFGATAAEAFFVKCDRTTMTQDDIDNGRLICLIGVAPVKPAEFVIFRISQKTSEAQS